MQYSSNKKFRERKEIKNKPAASNYDFGKYSKREKSLHYSKRDTSLAYS